MTNKLNSLRELKQIKDEKEKSLYLSGSVTLNSKETFSVCLRFQRALKRVNKKKLVKLIDGVAHEKIIPFNSFENRFSISSTAV